MKLELKHLAPYLPYCLKVKTGISLIRTLCLETPVGSDTILHVPISYLLGGIGHRLILRPLSDLLEHMPECEGTYAQVMVESILNTWCNEEYTPAQFCYELANGIIKLGIQDAKVFLDFLYMNHFDVESYFNNGRGLIDAGLAISYKEAGL